MKHAHNFKDITGKKYGFLTALRPTGIAKTYNEKTKRTFKRAVWLFKCECGVEVEKPRATCEQYLRDGLTLSCGCKSHKVHLGNKHGLWKGYGEISGTYFNHIKKSASKGGRRTKNIEFNVTIEYLWNLFLKQNRRCAYTDEELCFGTFKGEAMRATASLDRIDSNKGYVEGNLQWIHKTLNLMKQDLPDAIFVDWCKRVATNST